MGPVAGGGGEEEAENLSTIACYTTSSIHLLNNLVMRVRAREPADGSQKRDCRGLVVGM